jgi:hypothetical protein
VVVQAWIGYGIEPLPQLRVYTIEVAEGAREEREEEVLADIAVGTLDFALCPIRTAGLRLVPVMPGEVDQRPVVDNAAGGLMIKWKGFWTADVKEQSGGQASRQCKDVRDASTIKICRRIEIRFGEGQTIQSQPAERAWTPP